GRRGRGQDEVAQRACSALLRAQGHRAHVAPHVLEHLEAAAGAHAGTGIGVHVQPVGAAVSGTLHADGGIVRNTLEFLDAAHGTAPDYGRWRTGLYVPGCYTAVWQGPEAKKARRLPGAPEVIHMLVGVPPAPPAQCAEVSAVAGAASRSSLRRILPTLLLGSSLRNSIWRGC